MRYLLYRPRSQHLRRVSTAANNKRAGGNPSYYKRGGLATSSPRSPGASRRSWFPTRGIRQPYRTSHPSTQCIPRTGGRDGKAPGLKRATTALGAGTSCSESPPRGLLHFVW
eukprot:6227161-Heterocapsa_arctica.AAC.1